jgi:8-oxo-dGTP pyrophosphatase MutT (NUDIX family)
MTLLDQITIEGPASSEINRQFVERLSQGDFTRDENPTSHFCVYFLPYNPKAKTVFITHHKKSGLWISPGGHIDQGENLLEALVREVREELGFVYAPPTDFKPFLRTITLIDNPKVPCKIHFDTWCGIETDGSNFNVDPSEFFDTRWLTILEARRLVVDRPNREAFDKIEMMFQ